MWEQIAVRIVIALILQRMKEKHLIEDGTILESRIKIKNIVTVRALETIITDDPDIQDTVVEIGIELSAGIFKILDFLKGAK